MVGADESTLLWCLDELFRLSSASLSRKDHLDLLDSDFCKKNPELNRQIGWI